MLQDAPEIRPAYRGDQTEIARLLAIADPPLGARMDCWLAEGLVEFDDLVVCSLGREMTGVACAPVRPLHVEGAWQPFGVLCALHVAPDMRGRRLGPRMLETLVDHHREAHSRGMVARIWGDSLEYVAAILERRGFAPLWRSTVIELTADYGSRRTAPYREVDPEERLAGWRRWATSRFPCDRDQVGPPDAEWLHVEADEGERLLMRYREGVLYDPLPLDPIDCRRAAVTVLGVYRALYPERQTVRWRTAENSPWAEALGPQTKVLDETASALYLLGYDRVVDVESAEPEMYGVSLF